MPSASTRTDHEAPSKKPRTQRVVESDSDSSSLFDSENDDPSPGTLVSIDAVNVEDVVVNAIRGHQRSSVSMPSEVISVEDVVIKTEGRTLACTEEREATVVGRMQASEAGNAGTSTEAEGASASASALVVTGQDVIKAEDVAAGAPLRLEKGTRLEVYWDEDELWYAGCVASRWSETRGYLIRYDDGQRQWEKLDEVTWQWPADKAGAEDSAPKLSMQESVAILSQPAAPVTRSMRHDVKVRCVQASRSLPESLATRGSMFPPSPPTAR